MWRVSALSSRVERKVVKSCWRPFVTTYNLSLENCRPNVPDHAKRVSDALFEFYGSVEDRVRELLETGNPYLEIHIVGTMEAVIFCEGVVVGVVRVKVPRYRR